MRLIDADAARENTVERWTPVGSKVVSNFLDAQPTIDAVPVIHAHITCVGFRFYCSNCGESTDIGNDYCPHCGAKMDAPDGGGV